MSLTECESRLRILASQAWDDEIKWTDIIAWAENFAGTTAPKQDEELHSLFALSRFMYFSRKLTKEMLKALYRDHFESPTMQRIRRNFKDTKDVDLLRKQYRMQLEATRFVGLGNPAESGAHLLYVFRQVNYLPVDYFADLLSAFLIKPSLKRPGEVEYQIRDASVNRIVFFDDVVGSATQASKYLIEEIRKIRAGNSQIELNFLSLFATTEGLEKLNRPELFNGRAACLFELDSSFKAFSTGSRYFTDAPEWFNVDVFRKMARTYGKKLKPRSPFGYKDGQLLLAFAHNTPNNTLPIFWDQGILTRWHPVFPRFDKKYF